MILLMIVELHEDRAHACPALCLCQAGHMESLSEEGDCQWMSGSILGMSLGSQHIQMVHLLFNSYQTVARRRQWHPTPVLLSGKSHGWRSLVGCNPWGHEELDTTEQLHSDFSLSCTGEGNCNPLQCSFLENPRDREAWWAAVYGVTQSQTQLKWLSSSKCITFIVHLISIIVLSAPPQIIRH